MNRCTLIVLCTISICLFSCVEKFPNVIKFHDQQNTDTTYVASTVEQPQAKTMFIEEFTGASCTQCPAGAKQLENIAATLGDRLIITALHVYQMKTLGGPVPDMSKYDFRTQKGSDLLDIFYPGLNGIPSIGLDRVDYEGKNSIDRGKWPAAIDERKSATTPVNLTVTSAYNEQNREAVITVTIAYTQAVARHQYLSLHITEDGIIDVQKDGNEIDNSYTFNHVLRDYITNVSGDEFLEKVPEKEAGRVYRRSFSYKVNDAWKAENCHIVAFVHNNDGESKEILQAAATALK